MPRLNSVRSLTQYSESSTYLLLISPEKIPHLVIVRNGKYYSLTHKKSIVACDFGPYFIFLKNSGRKVLFVELNTNEDGPKKAFEKYEKVNTENISCLDPIKEWLLPNEQIEYVFELIPTLYEKNRIIGVQQINMDDDLDGGQNFLLSKYSKKDIFSYIEELNRH